MELYHYFPGRYPVVVSIPHAGTYVPNAILKRFLPHAKHLPDTDWHVEQLYAFAREMGVHMLIATHSRYVVDLNRDPHGHSLYPGKFTTGLCPNTLFDGTPLYANGLEVDDQEQGKRIHTYWQPYHDKLQAILNELRTYRHTILLDAHSIRSEVPTLFEGILPDLNLGTANGASANPDLTEKLLECCKQSSYSAVCNGRFKGGYITRHYGNPAENIHAIQLELSQQNYMLEDYPFSYHPIEAKKLQETLQKFVSILLDWDKHA